MRIFLTALATWAGIMALLFLTGCGAGAVVAKGVHPWWKALNVCVEAVLDTAQGVSLDAGAEPAGPDGGVSP